MAKKITPQEPCVFCEAQPCTCQTVRREKSLRSQKNEAGDLASRPAELASSSDPSTQALANFMAIVDAEWKKPIPRTEQQIVDEIMYGPRDEDDDE